MTPSRIAALWLLAAAAASAQDLDLPLAATGRAATGRAAVETGLDLAASALAGALRHSRDQARAEGTLPMPPRIREALLDWYPADLLDGITYRIGTTETATVQSFSIRYGEATAVAAIDTITFADPWDAENNIALWGHEVKHVEQFRAWGVYGFARRYLRDHDAVVRDAYAIGATLKALHGGG